MKSLFLLFLLFMQPALTQSDGVYLCTGPQSKRYHCRSTCRGLNNCSEDIVRVSLAKARSMGRTQCGICYN